jgi:cysteinyl-tRNA synthetase
MKLAAKILLLFNLTALPLPGAELKPASFAYILQSDSFAKSKAVAVEKLTACDRDWIVLDAVYSNDTPWEVSDLNTIRAGKAGRKLIAYISIGEAEDYRPYWRKEWGTRDKLTAAAPAWLGAENPAWQGNYRVKYWHAEWQQLILAAVDDAMARGFDGIYLDIVDGFETYEQEGQNFFDNRPNLETKQTYRRDMVDWVKTIAARARAKKPAALVIPQNGSQLAVNVDFVAAISAIGIEDLFTNGNKFQPQEHTDEILKYLAIIAAAEKPTLVIEYPKKTDVQQLVKKLAKEQGSPSLTHAANANPPGVVQKPARVAGGLVWLITDRQLKTLGESGN